MAGTRRGRGVGAAAGAILALTLAGCASTAQPLTAPVGPGTSPWDSVTATRAGYVKLMLSNAMGTASLTGAGLDDVVLDYGGGYITSVTGSGPGSTDHQEHTAEVVLGVIPPRDRMQGETDLGYAAVGCYRYRIGYYSYLVSYASTSCPGHGSPALQQSVASSWAAAVTAAQELSAQGAAGPVPTSLAQAEARLPSPFPAASLTPSDFATGREWIPGNEYGQPVAALAVPLSNETCAYVGFSDQIDRDGTHELAVTGFAAPWQASCDGADALAEAIPFSADPTAGG